MSRRTTRVSELLREEISELVQRDLKDPRLEGAFLTITEVEVSPDFRVASVFVSHLGSAEERDDAAGFGLQVEAVERRRFGAGKALGNTLAQDGGNAHRPLLGSRRIRNAVGTAETTTNSRAGTAACAKNASSAAAQIDVASVP